jgi:hypothetical protein
MRHIERNIFPYPRQREIMLGAAGQAASSMDERPIIEEIDAHGIHHVEIRFSKKLA